MMLFFFLFSYTNFIKAPASLWIRCASVAYAAESFVPIHFGDHSIVLYIQM